MVDTLICCRTAHMPHPPTPGSISINCNQCNRMVWIAPSGQALLKKEPHTKVVCMECVPNAELLLSDATRHTAPGCRAELEAFGISDTGLTTLEHHFNLDEPIT